jgi:hypothetical protein
LISSLDKSLDSREQGAGSIHPVALFIRLLDLLRDLSTSKKTTIKSHTGARIIPTQNKLYTNITAKMTVNRGRTIRASLWVKGLPLPPPGISFQ